MNDLRITAVTASHIGHVRKSNEDSLWAGKTVFAVADGLGGHAAGEVASAIAVGHIAELDGQPLGDDPGATLGEAAGAANAAILAAGRIDASQTGMGTTLTAATMVDDRLIIAHIGDSRAYLCRGEEVRQLTVDHAVGRHTLTRALGLEPEVTIDVVQPQPLQRGDVVLLCTDGLCGVLSEEELDKLLMTGDATPDSLVQAALAAGGPDNVTVVLLHVS